MAKFILMGDWPVGQFVVPAGAALDWHDPQWNGLPLPLPFPLEAKALDQEGLDLMCDAYGHGGQGRADHTHLLHHVPGLKPKKEWL